MDKSIDMMDVVLYNIESVVTDIRRSVALMEGLESNFRNHIEGKGSISVESFSNYLNTTEVMLSVAGIDLPATTVIAAFESERGDSYEAEAESKLNAVKDKVVTAVKAMLTKLKTLLAKFMEIFKKKSETKVKDLALTLEDLESKPNGPWKKEQYEVNFPSLVITSSGNYNSEVGRLITLINRISSAVNVEKESAVDTKDRLDTLIEALELGEKKRQTGGKFDFYDLLSLQRSYEDFVDDTKKAIEVFDATVDKMSNTLDKPEGKNPYMDEQRLKLFKDIPNYVNKVMTWKHRVGSEFERIVSDATAFYVKKSK